MPVFSKGIVLEQHKEPMLTEKIFTVKHESRYFDCSFPDTAVEDLSEKQIIEIARLAEIIDEDSGRMLADELEEAEKGITVIADAMDDEPYISSQMAMAVHCRDELAEGLSLASRAIGSGSCQILIYKTIFDLNTHIPKDINGIDVISVGGRYPVESRAFRKLKKKSDNIIIGAQALVHLARAAEDSTVMTTTFVTVAGDIIERPQNMEVPIGAKVSDIIDMCVPVTEPEVIVLGGSMTGKSIFEPDEETVDVCTPGILAFRKSYKTYTYRCIGCGRCDHACPVGLTPSMIRKHAEIGIMDDSGILDADKCISCGACSYACPARLDVEAAVLKMKRYAESRKADTNE